MTVSTPNPTDDVTHWLNLSNGLQALVRLPLPHHRIMYLRSSHCEVKKWDAVMASVPDEMLLRLAIGQECIVYDYGARKEVPRSIWQGLEFVKYVLYRRWFGEEYQPQGRASASKGYFSWHYHKVVDDPADKKLKRRLDYYRDYVQTCAIRLSSVTGVTEREMDKEWNKRTLVNLKP